MPKFANLLFNKIFETLIADYGLASRNGMKVQKPQKWFSLSKALCNLGYSQINSQCARSMNTKYGIFSAQAVALRVITIAATE